jgi:hypothetical protein
MSNCCCVTPPPTEVTTGACCFLDSSIVQVPNYVISHQDPEYVNAVEHDGDLTCEEEVNVLDCLSRTNSRFYLNSDCVDEIVDNCSEVTCFIADSKVLLSDGTYKNIQDVSIGDKVKSLNSDNNVIGLERTVLGRRKLVSLNGSKAFFSYDHPIYTEDGLKSVDSDVASTLYPHLDIVGDLEIGDVIITPRGEESVQTIELKESDEETALYDLKLDGNNIYFVENVAVHNCSRRPCCDWSTLTCTYNYDVCGGEGGGGGVIHPRAIKEIARVTGDVHQTPTTITITYSFIIAGTMILNEGYPVHSSSTLESSGVTHEQFVSTTETSLAIWKAAFEHICPWLTLNFVNLGDELDNNIPSDGNIDTTYSIPNNSNVGDFRFGMHKFDGPRSVLAHGYYPQSNSRLGSIGSVAGDSHYDSAETWRMDGVDTGSGFTIKRTLVHEIGHMIGIAHLCRNCGFTTIMAGGGANEGIDFDVLWPNGVIGSATDLDGLKEVYPPATNKSLVNRCKDCTSTSTTQTSTTTTTTTAKPTGACCTDEGDCLGTDLTSQECSGLGNWHEDQGCEVCDTTTTSTTSTTTSTTGTSTTTTTAGPACPDESCEPHYWAADFEGCPEAHSTVLCVPNVNNTYSGTGEYSCGGGFSGSWKCDPTKAGDDPARWTVLSFSTDCFTGVSLTGATLSPGDSQNPPTWEFTATGAGNCGCCGGGTTTTSTPQTGCCCVDQGGGSWSSSGGKTEEECTASATTTKWFATDDGSCYNVECSDPEPDPEPPTGDPEPPTGDPEPPTGDPEPPVGPPEPPGKRSTTTTPEPPPACPETACSPHYWSINFQGCPVEVNTVICGDNDGNNKYSGKDEYSCGGSFSGSFVCDPSKYADDPYRWTSPELSTDCFTGVSFTGEILSPGGADTPHTWEFTATGLGGCGCCTTTTTATPGSCCNTETGQCTEYDYVTCINLATTVNFASLMWIDGGCEDCPQPTTTPGPGEGLGACCFETEDGIDCKNNLTDAECAFEGTEDTVPGFFLGKTCIDVGCITSTTTTTTTTSEPTTTPKPSDYPDGCYVCRSCVDKIIGVLANSDECMFYSNCLYYEKNYPSCVYALEKKEVCELACAITTTTTTTIEPTTTTTTTSEPEDTTTTTTTDPEDTTTTTDPSGDPGDEGACCVLGAMDNKWRCNIHTRSQCDTLRSTTLTIFHKDTACEPSPCPPDPTTTPDPDDPCGGNKCTWKYQDNETPEGVWTLIETCPEGCQCPEHGAEPLGGEFTTFKCIPGTTTTTPEPTTTTTTTLAPEQMYSCKSQLIDGFETRSCQIDENGTQTKEQCEKDCVVVEYGFCCDTSHVAEPDSGNGKCKKDPAGLPYTSQDKCDTAGGIWYDDEIESCFDCPVTPTTTTTTGPPPLGVCCPGFLGDCSITIEAECYHDTIEGAGGEWTSYSDTFTPEGQPTCDEVCPKGTCCYYGGACEALTQKACGLLPDSVWYQKNSQINPNATPPDCETCPTPPPNSCHCANPSLDTINDFGKDIGYTFKTNCITSEKSTPCDGECEWIVRGGPELGADYIHFVPTLEGQGQFAHSFFAITNKNLDNYCGTCDNTTCYWKESDGKWERDYVQSLECCDGYECVEPNYTPERNATASTPCKTTTTTTEAPGVCCDTELGECTTRTKEDCTGDRYSFLEGDCDVCPSATHGLCCFESDESPPVKQCSYLTEPECSDLHGDWYQGQQLENCNEICAEDPGEWHCSAGDGCYRGAGGYYTSFDDCAGIGIDDPETENKCGWGSCCHTYKYPGYEVVYTSCMMTDKQGCDWWTDQDWTISAVFHPGKTCRRRDPATWGSTADDYVVAPCATPYG